MTKSWKWFKRILWVLLGLFVLLFLAVSVFVYIINSESYLEDYLKENLGVEAQVGELDVSLLSGTVKVSSSVIGPKDDPFIQFEQLEGELDYSHLWSSQLTVELLQLTNAKVRYPFEFKLKESEERAEATSLPFDFIDVAAIDVNNLDFEYRGEVSLFAEGANVKVRNLPVAEDGFLLFEDLQRLVKASKTTLQAELKTLSSDKTELNQLSLNAHIEEQRLIIDEINSGQSSININLLDHSQGIAAAAEDEKVTAAVTPEKDELDLPFSDVVIKTIDLGKTDLAIQDKQELSIKAIEAEFSELLLVKDKKALWLDWPAFYKAQDSNFTLSSQSMQSDILGFESLSLEGELKQGQFVIPKLNLIKPLVRINTDDNTDEATSTGEVEASGSNAWHLPFKAASLANAAIEQGELQLTTDDEEHSVSDIEVELANIPLIMNHQPLFAIESLDVGGEEASVALNNAAYSGAYGTIDKLTSTLALTNSVAEIRGLAITNPDIQYQVSSEANSQSGPASETASEAGSENKGQLPVSTISLSNLKVDNASVDLAVNDDSYVGEGVNVELSGVPLYEQGEWRVASPDRWQEQINLVVSAQSVEVPQGRLSGLSLSSEYVNNQLTLTQVDLAGADLTINAAADDADQSSPSSDNLPIDYVQLNNIDLQQVNLKYQNDDVRYQIADGHLALGAFPLVRQGQLVSEPMPHFDGTANRMSLNVAELITPEGKVTGLESQGTLRNKDLMLDYLRTNSADLTLKQVATEPPESDQQETLEKQEKPQNFALRTVKIGDLKLRNVNAEFTQEAGEDSKTYLVKNLYLGATELLLAKNHQTIDQWYGSQLENAFTLVALKVEKIAQEQNDVNNLTVTAVQSGQKITVEPLRMTVNEAPISAKWVIDLSQQPYRSNYISDFKNLSLDKLVDPADESSVAMSGNLQGDIDIEFSGLDSESIVNSLDGRVLVSNQTPVTLHRLNVNKVLRSFLDTQKFGLLDVGGFLLAGPLGLLASQGVNLQDTLSQLGADKGDTHFSHFNVDMDIKDGVLTTKDVAAATLKYRFAFNGRVDLGKQEFKDFEFDIINEKGCSEYGQTLNGSLLSPEIETFTAAFDAVTGSITGLFKQGVGLITGGACSAVYEGVVPHPKDGAEIIPKDQQRTIDPNAKGDSEIGAEEGDADLEEADNSNSN